MKPAGSLTSAVNRSAKSLIVKPAKSSLISSRSRYRSALMNRRVRRTSPLRSSMTAFAFSRSSRNRIPCRSAPIARPSASTEPPRCSVSRSIRPSSKAVLSARASTRVLRNSSTSRNSRDGNNASRGRSVGGTRAPEITSPGGRLSRLAQEVVVLANQPLQRLDQVLCGKRAQRYALQQFHRHLPALIIAPELRAEIEDDFLTCHARRRDRAAVALQFGGVPTQVVGGRGRCRFRPGLRLASLVHLPDLPTTGTAIAGRTEPDLRCVTQS